MLRFPLRASLRNVWSSYEARLEARPAATKAAVAASMFAITDVAVQRLERYDASGANSSVVAATTLDAKRVMTQAGFGAYYGVVHAHLIWGALERLFSKSLPAAGISLPPLRGAVARVAADQFFIGTPLFNSVFFYSTGRFAQGMSHAEACQNVADRLLPMVVTHWSFWVPFHTLNFYLVPFRHRVLPAQAALFGWSAFLSYTGAKRSPAQDCTAQRAPAGAARPVARDHETNL